ncbi:DUF4240 domain-containing protein [Streptomyces sp. DT171]|uniref:DUF4240 domain-containing protein n=1 Tax=Streptomyces sp. DT171 TaxID=3416524 RepID=UPI003CF635F5
MRSHQPSQQQMPKPRPPSLGPALAWLRTDLSRRTQEEIVEFQLCLDQLTRQAFTWELVAAAERIFGGRCSDDDFDYFGLWMVGLVGEVFGRACLTRMPWPMLLRSWRW